MNDLRIAYTCANAEPSDEGIAREPCHVCLVGMSVGAADHCRRSLERAQFRVTHRLSAEGVIGAMSYDPAAVYVAAVALPGEPLAMLVRWLRGNAATRGSFVLGIAHSDGDESVAMRAGADAFVRAPRWRRALGPPLVERIAIEMAIRAV